MDISGTDAPRRVVLQYLVPVHVEVEDGLVCRVTVIDETPVLDPVRRQHQWHRFEVVI